MRPGELCNELMLMQKTMHWTLQWRDPILTILDVQVYPDLRLYRPFCPQIHQELT